MKYLKEIFIVLMLIAGSAWATTPTPDPVTVGKLVGLGMRPELAEFVASQNTILSNAEWIRFLNAAGSANINAFVVDGTDDTVVNADSGDVIKFAVAGTPVVQMDASGLTTDLYFATGKGVREAVAIITPDVDYTPAAANVITTKVTRCVAGCPTIAAAYLPEASTTTIGATYQILNEGSYPLLVFPNLTGGTNTVNAGGAGTPISLATGETGICTGLTATGWRCAAVPLP